MTSPATRVSPARAGWIPNQHGAWAMLVAPYLVGVVFRVRAGRFDLGTVTLGVTWFVGYLAFFAVSLWLKSGRRARFAQAARVYSLITAVAGVVTLVLRPGVWTWAPWFAPLAVSALWFASRRHDRAVLSGFATTLAACVMAPAAYSNATTLAGPFRAEVVAAAIILFGYFFGTVLYVKTMIRRRGALPYFLGSIAYHAGLTIAATYCALAGIVTVPVAVFFGVATVRAVALPLWQDTFQRPLRPGTVGVIELVFTGAVLVIVLVGAVP